jgi:hypothetical protein
MSDVRRMSERLYARANGRKRVVHRDRVRDHGQIVLLRFLHDERKRGFLGTTRCHDDVGFEAVHAGSRHRLDRRARLFGRHGGSRLGPGLA